MIREHVGASSAIRQVLADYERLLQQHVSAVTARLDDALRKLLGLQETEEHALLQTCAFGLREGTAQPRLFQDWDLLPPVPPPPPVKLVPPELLMDGGEIAPETVDRIRGLLRFWEDVVNSRPPRELYEEGITEQAA